MRFQHIKYKDNGEKVKRKCLRCDKEFVSPDKLKVWFCDQCRWYRKHYSVYDEEPQRGNSK